MPQSNRRIVLAERPTGNLEASTVRLEQSEIADPGEGQALLRNRFLSIDPTIRTWMDDVAGYLPPIGIDEVIRSGGVAEVVSSRSPRYAEGDLVFGMTGWQEYALAGSDGTSVQVLPAGIDPTAALSVFGATGMTAYFGLLEVGRVLEGDTVVVSGAAGATGSVVGQLARIKGAGRVVGIAGTEEKCAWLVDELGFDAADLYFDNVGGELLDICLGQLALRGRIVLCGAIASYNSREQIAGPRNYRNLIPKRGRMEGFIILDYLDRFPDGQAAMAGWVAEGKVKFAVHLVDGLENAPDALNLLFTGGNTGKLIVRLD
jgi:NADPH-dependent curcumin reductase CurA